MNGLLKLFLIIMIFVIIMSFVRCACKKNKNENENEKFGGGAYTQLYATGPQDYYLSDGLANRWRYPFGIWNIPTRIQSWWNFYHIPYWEYPWRYMYY